MANKSAVAKKLIKKPAKAPAKKTAIKKPVAKLVAKNIKKPIVVKKPVAKKAAAPAKKPVAVKKTATLVKMPVAAKSAPVAKAPEAKKPDIKKPVATAPQAAAKKADKGESFDVNCHVVYPTHGVGRITAIETQNIGEIELKVFVIAFDKDKMTLRVPVHRAAAAGLRNISGKDQIEKAFSTLKGRARTSRGMWSRRAQEYEAKINSGNLVAIAEVVRDLHKNVEQSERSYSERMIYEAAFGRMVGELAAADAVDMKKATEKLIDVLRKQAA